MRHQLNTMPETQEIAELTSRHQALEREVRSARMTVDELTAEQKKADRDVEQVKSRRERDRARMDAGQITNPKDLARMQHELQSLERRISTLEDEELEVMEKVEEAETELSSLTGQVTAAEERLVAVTAERDEKAVDLNASVDSLTAERATAVEGMPEALLALYTKLREQKNGVGAAALRARQCGGCRLGLDSAELARVAKAPSDDVIRCEECSRILVRTSESGI